MDKEKVPVVLREVRSEGIKLLHRWNHRVEEMHNKEQNSSSSGIVDFIGWERRGGGGGNLLFGEVSERKKEKYICMREIEREKERETERKRERELKG